MKHKLFFSIFNKNKKNLFLLYFILVIETLNYTLLPYVLGNGINGLKNNDFSWLYIYVFQHLFNVSIATSRKIFDTKLFTKMHNEIVFKTILFHRENNIGISTTNARIGLLYSAVGFFESDLPELFRSSIQIVGATIMIYFYSSTLLYICLLLIIPAFFLNRNFGRKNLKITSILNSSLENQTDVITNYNQKKVKEYFSEIRMLKIRLSNLDAYNFTYMQFFNLLLLLVIVNFIFKNSNTILPGDFYALIAYTLRYSQGFDFLPQLVERLSILKDLQIRLDKMLY
ncbi:MAG: ABC transporter six-transmembrane domain-containing protein [Sediminibacterium sp.]|nr:ABC transporter six-transmembrane domain-containing protein [Sediminibacterium sp.]MDP3128103.1 ABC transporter six-transmembrane domain-containing protein [Sediminibacterium sp.]